MKWLRKRIGWIAAAAVIGMVLWLVFTAVSLRNIRVDSPGRLFGRNVSAHELQHALTAVTHDAMLRYGDQYRRRVSDSQLQQQAWERLILLSEVRRQKIRVTDAELAEEIARYPLFQQSNGQFDKTTYQTVLQYSLGTTPHIFEEETRENLAVRKLLQKSIGNPTLSEEEVRQGFRRREEQIRLRTLLVPRESLAREIADVCRQTPAQLDSIAGQLRLPIKKTDFFKRNTAAGDLGNAGGNLEPAFRLRAGETSPALPTPSGWIVAQLLERREADESRLASARGPLEKELLDQKRLKAYLTWYQDLLKRADPRQNLKGV